MVDPQTDEERSALKVDAIRRLRSLEASLDRSEEIHHYRERGLSHVVPPSMHESFNDALRDLQRAGENIPDTAIRPADTTRYRAEKSAPYQEWVNGSALRTDVKRILAQVDPTP